MARLSKDVLKQPTNGLISLREGSAAFEYEMSTIWRFKQSRERPHHPNVFLQQMGRTARGRSCCSKGFGLLFGSQMEKALRHIWHSRSVRLPSSQETARCVG